MNTIKRIRIKFYAHMIFDKPEMCDMLRAVDIVTNTIDTICKVFNGKPVYSGNGSEMIQYNDVVEFESLSDYHLSSILNIYNFARQLH